MRTRAWWWLVPLALAAGGAWLLVSQGGSSVSDLELEGPREASPAPQEPGGPGLEGLAHARPKVGAGKAGASVLRGRVVDAKGAPAAGVLVEASPAAWNRRRPAPNRAWADGDWREPDPPAAVTASATSESDGTFRLTGLSAREGYTLWARPAPPRAGSSLSVRPLEDGPGEPPTLVVTDGSALRLRVVDAAGQGLRAWVGAWDAASISPGRAAPVPRWFQPETLTDPEGRLVIASAPPGWLDVSARVPGVIARRGIAVRAPASEEVVLRLGETGGMTVTGRVTDVAGKGIAGARVLASAGVARLGTGGPTTTLLVTCAADGSYRVEHLPAGRLESLVASATGYRPQAAVTTGLSAAEGGTLTLDLTLVRGSVVAGRVLGPAGEPIAGALVAIRPQRQVAPDAGSSGLSDEGGRYRLEGVGVGQARVTALAEGWYQPRADASAGDGAATGVFLDVADEGLVLEKDLRMERGIPVRGLARDASGAPVAGALITAYFGADRRRGGAGLPTTATSDATGAFTFAGLEPGGLWSFEARSETLRSERSSPITLSVSAAPPAPVDLTLHPVATLGGRLVDPDGAPASGMTVLLDRGVARTTSDAQGRFAFTGLAAGTYTLSAGNAWMPGAGVRAPPTHALAWGQTLSDIVLTVPNALAVEGVLVDEQDRPLPRVQFHVQSAGSERNFFGWTTTDTEGAFRVEALASGSYVAAVPGCAPSEPFTAPARGLRLVARAATQRVLEGRVLGPDGKPVGSGQVMVWTGLAGQRHSGSGVGLWNGRFRAEVPAEADSVDVSVQDACDVVGRPLNARPLRLANVDPGAGPLEIRLEEGMVVAGRVVDEKGSGVEGVEVIPRVRSSPTFGNEVVALTDTTGRFRCVGLAPGPVALDVRAPRRFAQPAPLDVAAGEESIVVRLEPGLGLEGRVLGGDAPQAGLQVQVWWEVKLEGGASTTRNQNVTTDADGRFRIEGLGREPVSLSVQGPRDARAATWPYLGLTQQGLAPGTKDLVLRLEEGVRIEGEVLGPQGEPVLEADVQVEPAEDRGPERRGGRGGFQRGGFQSDTRLIGGTNRFSIGPLPPGRYIVSAAGRGVLGRSERVEVQAPATRVRLVLARAFLLSGRVHGDASGAFTGQFLQVKGEHRLNRGIGIGRDGTFAVQCENDDEGILYIYRSGSDAMAWIEDVRPSRSPYEVRLEPGLRIEGRIDGFPSTVPQDGSHPQIAALGGTHGIQVHGVIEPDGRFSIRGLPRGTYSIQAWWGSPQQNCRQSDVAAGTRDLVLRPAAR